MLFIISFKSLESKVGNHKRGQSLVVAPFLDAGASVHALPRWSVGTRKINMKIKSTLLTIYLLPVAAYSVGPSGPPGDAANAMYSLSDICQRLDSGASGEKRVFSDPTSAPGTKIACSLNELMDKAPVIDDSNGAVPGHVIGGQTYWGLVNGSWGKQVGTMPFQGAKTYTPSAVEQAGGAGYYESIVIKYDANLKPENIRAGVTIFGVVGTYIPPKDETPTVGSTFRDTLKDGGSGPEMVMIPAGSFRMGDIQGGGSSDEQPVHSVSVGQFAMGKFEVTVGEFKKFVNATGYQTDAEKQNSCYVYKDGSWSSQKGANWQNLNFSQNDNHPVACVSWNDGTAYAEWLSNQTGFEANVFSKLLPRKQYRLPTEAEWEYAARAGTETKYWWGNTASHEYANYGTDSCCAGLAEGKDRWEYTSPVGSFAANKFGLYDTSGNLWEWACSEYEDKYNGKEKACITKNSNEYRVLRGGSWYYYPWFVRTANRNGYTPDNRYGFNGFRVVVMAAAWTN